GAAALGVPRRRKMARGSAAVLARAGGGPGRAGPGPGPLRSPLDYIMAQQEPFPAVAVDRHWTMLAANNGAARLVTFLVGPLPPDAKVNLADALVGPDVLRPFLVNWPDVVRYFIRSLEADAAAD